MSRRVIRTPEAFLEYAQKIEELKLFDEQQSIHDSISQLTQQNNVPIRSSNLSRNYTDTSQHTKQIFSNDNNNVPNQ